MKNNLLKKSIVIGIIFLLFGLGIFLNTNAYTICKHKKHDKIEFLNQVNVIDDILVGTITVNNNEVNVKCLDKEYETRNKSITNINLRVDYEMVGTGEMNCGIYIKSHEEIKDERTKPPHWDRDDGRLRIELGVLPKEYYTIVVWGTNGDDYEECDATVGIIHGRGKNEPNNINIFQNLEIFTIIHTILCYYLKI